MNFHLRYKACAQCVWLDWSSSIFLLWPRRWCWEEEKQDIIDTNVDLCVHIKMMELEKKVWLMDVLRWVQEILLCLIMLMFYSDELFPFKCAEWNRFYFYLFFWQLNLNQSSFDDAWKQFSCLILLLMTAFKMFFCCRFSPLLFFGVSDN